MKICRFRRADGSSGLGLVESGAVADVSAVLDELPAQRYPLPRHDLLVEALPRLAPRIRALAAASAERLPLETLTLLAPVANPGKIIGAPINYEAHVAESKADPGIAHGRSITGIGDWGLFLKAGTALAGAGEGVRLRFAERRSDHEMELAVVIGRRAVCVAPSQALDHVAGYAIGLDMTLRGKEVHSWRKSIDSYAVLGPWLVTADEVADPGALDLWLDVNGQPRQRSNTRHLVYGVARLIAWASAQYTLEPGDVIMTGTPEGVGPVVPGDVMECGIAGIGTMRVAVSAFATPSGGNP
ncbi:MAG TPA: fumarylacetoacetate hydrolase family protein [Burkholderiaceae bacterium]|nr:fumarylacetoacetate hydrolase family protein [Burkholderiaceae bacterium]